MKHNNEKAMNTEQLESLIDRHGPDTSEWPDNAETKLALDFLERNVQAREILEANRSLYQDLSDAMRVNAPLGIESRILARVAEVRRSWWSGAVAQWLLRPALVAIPFVIGFVVGISITDSSTIIESEIASSQFEDHTDLVAFSP